MGDDDEQIRDFAQAVHGVWESTWGEERLAKEEAEYAQMEALQPGTIAILHGLQKAVHLNGVQCTCIKYIEDTGRWSVRLLTGGTASVNPENIQVFPQADESAGGLSDDD